MEMSTPEEVSFLPQNNAENPATRFVTADQEPARIFRQDEKESGLESTSLITIPVIEEQINVAKKIVETAKVHIEKVVYEDVEQFIIPLIEEHISVERIPKNEFVSLPPPAIRYEGDVMIISVLKEVPVIETRIMLVEELRVTKYKTEKNETHDVTLRKEKVDVHRTEVK